MGSNDEGVSLGKVAKILRETDKALLVVLEDDDARELWVPKSQIHDDSEVYSAETKGSIVVKEWWAKKEGLA